MTQPHPPASSLATICLRSSHSLQNASAFFLSKMCFCDKEVACIGQSWSVLTYKSKPALRQVMPSLTICYVACLLMINSYVHMHPASGTAPRIRSCTLPFTDSPGPHHFYMTQKRLCRCISAHFAVLTTPCTLCTCSQGKNLCV